MARRTTRHIRLTAAAALLAMLVLASPVGAFAANATWQSVDLSLIGANQVSGILLVTGKLAPQAPLPSSVTLAVPPGAQIGWVGEVLGGPASKDPNDKYSVTPGSGYDLVTFTLTRGRTGQAESGVPTGFTINGASTDAKFSWVAPYAISTVNLSIQFPSGTTVTGGTEGGQVFPSGTGRDYQLTIHNVKKGQNIQYAVSYTGGQSTSSTTPVGTVPQSTGSGTAGGPSGLTRILIIILAIAIFFLLLYLALRYVASSSPSGDSGKRKR